MIASDELAAKYPRYAEALTADTALASSGSGALTPRIRELVAVVTLAYIGSDTLASRMRIARDAGASVQDIVEALFTVATPGGQICLANGLRALAASEDNVAVKTPAVSAQPLTAREVSPASPWPWLDEQYPEYQALRRELNDLTFMPRNASLEQRYREILVAVVLACRRYPTVPQHLRRALEEGATQGEVFEAVNVASLIAGQIVLGHALPFMDRANRRRASSGDHAVAAGGR